MATLTPVVVSLCLLLSIIPNSVSGISHIPCGNITALIAAG